MSTLSPTPLDDVASTQDAFAPASLQALADRFDPAVFPIGSGHARVRLTGMGIGSWDVLLADDRALLEPADEGQRPDATIEATGQTWLSLAQDIAGGMEAFREGRLVIRHDLHLGVGFLAATAPRGGDEALRFVQVPTDVGLISTMQAGAGPPVLLVHGLGATKASFLPTVGALAGRHRVIALDLPGFGDSDKPFAAGYDAPFFARSVVALLDALELPSASLIGNSMGGRVALETGLQHPDRVDRLVLLAPALAWLRGRPFAPQGEMFERAAEYWRTLVSDPDAKFDITVELDAREIKPQVTWGTSPEMVTTIEGRVPDPDREKDPVRREGIERALVYMGLDPNTPITGIRVDKVFIGSCTNSRIEDLRAAAWVVERLGKRVAANVRQALVVPGSGLVKRQAEKEGLDKIFIGAGFEWREPGCSMCLAMNDDRLEPGERCASTSNRNFEGRQGTGGRTHLVSPAMAAAAAIEGHFVDVRQLA